MSQAPASSTRFDLLIDPEKYALMRAAILEALPDSDEGVLWAELTEQIGATLPERLFRHLGTVRWYARAVQLDLEARGEIERVPNSKPLRLRRVA